MAVGGNNAQTGLAVYVTTNGSTWNQVAPSGGPSEPFYQVSCASISDCWATDTTTESTSVWSTQDEGRTWTSVTLPESSITTGALTCFVPVNVGGASPIEPAVAVMIDGSWSVPVRISVFRS
jgi:photosystem II stability/assembly factor-like uncharacterized protein